MGQFFVRCGLDLCNQAFQRPASQTEHTDKIVKKVIRPPDFTVEKRTLKSIKG